MVHCETFIITVLIVWFQVHSPTTRVFDSMCLLPLIYYLWLVYLFGLAWFLPHVVILPPLT